MDDDGGTKELLERARASFPAPAEPMAALIRLKERRQRNRRFAAAAFGLALAAAAVGGLTLAFRHVGNVPAGPSLTPPAPSSAAKPGKAPVWLPT